MLTGWNSSAEFGSSIEFRGEDGPEAEAKSGEARP